MPVPRTSHFAVGALPTTWTVPPNGLLEITSG
jgi:hypothetical protein